MNQRVVLSDSYYTLLMYLLFFILAIVFFIPNNVYSLLFRQLESPIIVDNGSSTVITFLLSMVVSSDRGRYMVNMFLVTLYKCMTGPRW